MGPSEDVWRRLPLPGAVVTWLVTGSWDGGDRVGRANLARLQVDFVGDPRQLSPIGPGRPFVDLVNELHPDDFAVPARVGPSYVELRVPRRQLIDAFADHGQADLIPQLTFPFPVRVIARILGLPEADWPRFLRLSTQLIAVTRNWRAPSRRAGSCAATSPRSSPTGGSTPATTW